MSTGPLTVGIDLATATARIVVVDEHGGTVAEHAAALPAPERNGVRSEQEPRYAEVSAELITKAQAGLGDRSGAVRTLCITGTSGTVVPCDLQGVPEGNAVLYNDRRGGAEVRRLREVATTPAIAALIATPTSPLARLGWLAAHTDAARYLHTCDVVATMLLGRLAPTDTSHALKAGIDPVRAEWDDRLLEAVDVRRASLPELVHPGTVLGIVDQDVATRLGLPRGVQVVAGMTDGSTGQLAAGAVGDGDTVGVLGTTLVVKAVADKAISGFDGAVYSHYAPDGRYWPGGASNVGAGALRAEYGDADLAALDGQARPLRPDAVRYPLLGRGERFPFTDPDARGFTDGVITDRACAYRVLLEGIAFTERLGLETLAQLGIESRTHRLAGGASVSPVWNGIRASVLNRTLLRPERPSSAFGAAVLAAAAQTGEALTDVTTRMVRIAERVEPDPEQTERLDAGYRRLLDRLHERGLVGEAPRTTTQRGGTSC